MAKDIEDRSRWISGLDFYRKDFENSYNGDLLRLSMLPKQGPLRKATASKRTTPINSKRSSFLNL
jgi:hypothetical protein